MVRRSLFPVTHSVEIILLLATSGLLSTWCEAATNDPRTAQSWPELGRRSLAPSPAVSTPPPSNTTAPLNVAAPASNAACVQPPINNATWIKLGLDNYLANLPNGTSMNLQHYAASVGASNFIAGIGEKCNAGQLCSPVQAPGWEVLVAAQEWNNFQNKLYDSVGVACQIVTAISSSLVSDLYPPKHSGDLWGMMNTFSLATGISISTVILGVGIATAGESLLSLAALTVFAGPFGALGLAAVAVTAGVAGAVGVQLALQKPEPDAFDRWSVYAFYLSEWQQHAQKSISNSTKSIISAGVSSPQGISSVLKNGTYFFERPTVNEAELMSGLKNTTTVRILTDILRNQGAFVTINSDKCTSKGPGGAWKGNNKLSYCSPNGTMFNIIHGYKKKVINSWHNANLVAQKYGVTVQYLAEQSYHCQMNHGSANFDPYKSGAFPHSLDAECISNLPVCDFRIQEIAEAKKDKKTMAACRDVGKLPI